MAQHSKQRLTQHIGRADELDELGQGGAQVVALDLRLQRCGAQQRVLHAQRRQGEAPALHLTHQGHQALQACPQRCACTQRHRLRGTALASVGDMQASTLLSAHCRGCHMQGCFVKGLGSLPWPLKLKHQALQAGPQCYGFTHILHGCINSAYISE